MVNKMCNSICGNSISIYAAIFLISTGSVASAIQCFKCSMTPPTYNINETTRLCAQFDYSNKYVVDCPFSTMCMKKTFEWSLSNGDKIHGIERDCASQKYEHQVYANGKWSPKTDIEEAYEEGCHVEDDKGARTLPQEYCYCRRYLCNSATSNERGELSYHVDAMAVIFVFNAIRYFRSMEIG